MGRIDGEDKPINEGRKKNGGNVHIIGRLDKKLYSCVTSDIQTDEVIITEDRIEHIKARHGEDYENFFQYAEEMIRHPDYILEANKPHTALILKHITENGRNYQLILRLKTSVDSDKYKNSVITFLKIKDKEWRRCIKNKKILYKSE